MSLEKVPDLGSKPVSLVVKMPSIKNRGYDELGNGLREMYGKKEMTDITLHCADQTFAAHRVVLAAKSEVFRQGLAAPKEEQAEGSKHEVRLADISNPEAVKIMLDHIYQLDETAFDEYQPQTQEINKDVLRLAQNFRLPGLTDRATHWMAKNLTTGNVVERLQICQDFGLSLLEGKILEQLTLNKRALSEVAHSPQIMGYPKLMQALLQQAAGAPEPEEPAPAPKKKAEPAQPKKKARRG
mmetsp:Transcript_1189/g.2599  ORF Transcript_1189/g.2599 Transcript_1189/m.2599 type:complete len:241 (-) Transcript_1189:24-746(-)